LHPIKHFMTITRHRHLVMGYGFRAGPYRRGLLHDLSKYTPTEFWAGARYYLGNRSPNTAQRMAEGYSLAWMHHKGRNRHHFEYWTDFQEGREGYCPIPMPKEFLIESVMDRIAASKVYKGAEYYSGCELDYLLRSQEKSIMHPDTKDELVRILTMLRDYGEKETFHWIKHVYLRQI